MNSTAQFFNNLRPYGHYIPSYIKAQFSVGTQASKYVEIFQNIDCDFFKAGHVNTGDVWTVITWKIKMYSTF